MRTKRCLFIIVAVLLSAHVPLAYSADGRPSGNQVELRWSELGPFIAQGRVTAVLPDGTVLRGRTLAVNDDALVLDVRNTSNKKAYPKGRTSIPRDQVTTLSLREKKGIVGRTVLSVVGAFGALVVLALALGDTGADGVGGVATGAMVVGGVGGYYLGRRIDYRTTVIRIRPDQRNEGSSGTPQALQLDGLMGQPSYP